MPIAADGGRRLVAWLCTCGVLLSGCSLLKLSGGQLELINEQVPLARALERETDPERRALLAVTPDVIAFAEDVVGLHAGHSYRGYYHTERNGLTYVLTACRRDRFEAYTWWFPIAGEVEYRSYWDEDDARAAAAELEAQGYDTWISPSRAYSSLGILRDPICTTMLRDGLLGYVEVLIHELSHAKLYVPGHTDWNEALASFVGERGAERFFAEERYRHSVYAEAMRARALRREAFDRAVAGAYVRLEQLYASSAHAADKAATRAAELAALSREIAALYPEDDPARWQMNNARLLHFHRYSASGPVLLQLWAASGQNFRRFWELARAYAREHLS
jgi:predicted aminopeptidase